MFLSCHVRVWGYNVHEKHGYHQQQKCCPCATQWTFSLFGVKLFYFAGGVLTFSVLGRLVVWENNVKMNVTFCVAMWLINIMDMVHGRPLLSCYCYWSFFCFKGQALNFFLTPHVIFFLGNKVNLPEGLAN